MLDRPLPLTTHNRVRIIVLVPEDADIDRDDDPIETVIEELQQGFHERNLPTGSIEPRDQTQDSREIGVRALT